MAFALTPKQVEANRLLASPASNIMLRGGSRSGKTFLILRAICIRAMKARSRHAIWRFRFNHAKASIWQDTLPKVMTLCFPNVPLDKNETDLIATFPNGSQIVLGGLDDKARVEKVLGAEYSTLYFNESSQIPWSSVEVAMSRLAENSGLALKAYFDCVAGETILDGHTKTIAELAEAGEPITVMTTHGPRPASAPWVNGHGYVYTVTTSTGRTIRATATHRFWTRTGWQRLDQITIGHELLCTVGAQSPGDGLGVRAPTRTRPNSPENCCKCPHQCDGRSRPAQDGGLACPASASDGEPHNPWSRHHGGSDCRTGRQRQHAAQHSRRSQWSRGPLSQAFGGWTVRIQGLFGLQTCGPSPRKCQFAGPLPRAEAPTGSGTAPPPICRPRLALAWYWLAARDVAAIGIQWLRYSLPWPQFLGRKGPRPTELEGLWPALDTPLIDGCEYEMVVDISQPTAVAFYTVEVPLTRHYVANGFVSHNCNPPSKLHWSYQVFRQGLKPGTKERLANPDDYVEMQINPADNADNLPAKYFDILDGMSAAKRLRFKSGEWASEVNGALWSLEDRIAPDERKMPGIDSARITADQAPQMQRVVVAVDPSGTKGDGGGDDIGIVVAGKGVDGRAYILADRTCQLSPDGWGRRAVAAYHEFNADRVVGETNFGGDMVRFVVQTADKRAAYKEVHASRGKVVRAEPVSALYEQGLVSHVGTFADLEDQMCNMTSGGYVGEGSPDRADALVWALTELMLKAQAPQPVFADY